VRRVSSARRLRDFASFRHERSGWQGRPRNTSEEQSRGDGPAGSLASVRERDPGFMLRLMLGEVASVVTTGQRVLPKQALALGYTFKFPEIDAALRDVLA
jgi:hypothetical protein